jgi:hypothetical protein
MLLSLSFRLHALARDVSTFCHDNTPKAVDAPNPTSARFPR